jgi:hypothetical protein
MATATDIVTRALKRLRVTGVGESPSAAQVQSGTDALNAMIASWEAEGLSGDVLPLNSRFEQGIIAMLAVRLAGDYGKSPDAVLVRDADNGWSALQAAFFAVPQSTFDRALKWTGNYTDYGYFLGNEIDANAQWTGSTAYDLRQIISNQGNLYECTTAGTSAASGGPTGTGDDIQDGTCVWVWRRVDGSRNVGLTLE